MTKYIDAGCLRKLVEEKYNSNDTVGDIWDLGYDAACEQILDIIDSLQQEPTSDTDALHTELVNLLKTYRIGEETAITIADRIADTYGVQRYIDGLCDGLDKDTKQEQSDEDIDADIEMEWDSFNKHLREYDDDPEEVVWLDWYDFKDVAYYFYDLGLNARKEKQLKSVDLKHLIDWYIASVNEKEQPVWTEEHLKELLKDFILIPK